MLVAVLAGFIASLLLPFVRRAAGSGWLLCLLPSGLALFFMSHLPNVLAGQPVTSITQWFEGLGIPLSFRLDPWSMVFVLLITSIGTLVTLYAAGYLHGHPQKHRFFCFLFMFMASMLGTVLSANAILLFIFWELTSLSSYFLIGFDHDEEKSRKSALQALLVTGTGGLSMLAGFIILGSISGTYEIGGWISMRDALGASPLFLPAMALILLGAFTKSAQCPFHFWLPNAMVAPTPVSAYLHSSTMVKAGIYLIGRLTPLFADLHAWSSVLMWAGTATLLCGALMALRAKEMKRHLAYLTISSLGLLTLMLGVGSAEALRAAVVFLVAHALYKGALFMVAGSIHHATGERRTEGLSGLWRPMPLTAAASITAGASLSSLPLTLGFYAKESALASAPTLAALAISTAGAVYTAMFLAITVRPFLGPRSGPAHPHEAPASMWLGAAILAAAGVVFPFLLPHSSPVWDQIAATLSGHVDTADHHAAHHSGGAILWSVGSWTCGAALFFLRGKVLSLLSRCDAVFTAGPERVYHAAVDTMVRFACAFTRATQNGSLRHYFRVVVTTAVVLGGWGLVRAGAIAVHTGPFFFIESALAGMIVLATAAVLRTKEKLAAVAYLGVIGLAISLLFLLFGAPDLAMTQLAVETLTLLLLALVLYRLPDFKEHGRRSALSIDTIVSILAGVMMSAFVLATAHHGARSLPGVAEYYSQNTAALAHGHNIVNVILVDFRGFDTFGEITVLGIAGVGVYSLLRSAARRKKGGA